MVPHTKKLKYKTVKIKYRDKKCIVLKLYAIFNIDEITQLLASKKSIKKLLLIRFILIP